MCGRFGASPSLALSATSLSALGAMALLSAQASEDYIVEGFGVVPGLDSIAPGRRVVPTSEPQRVIKGRERGEAVADHLLAQSRELVDLYVLTAEGSATAAAVQAGAAAAQTLGDLLHALMAGDKASAKALLEACVNDAIQSGAVTV